MNSNISNKQKLRKLWHNIRDNHAKFTRFLHRQINEKESLLNKMIHHVGKATQHVSKVRKFVTDGKLTEAIVKAHQTIDKHHSTLNKHLGNLKEHYKKSVDVVKNISTHVNKHIIPHINNIASDLQNSKIPKHIQNLGSAVGYMKRTVNSLTSQDKKIQKVSDELSTKHLK
jgi:hypothetical protein